VTKKEEPQKCEAKLCCKATAELQLEVAKELEAEQTKSVANLLEEKKEETDEDGDTAR
jgi:hypothetical protein